MEAVKITPAPRLAATAATTIAPPHAGQIVGERYRLEEWLESGAMGSVWRAEQIRLRSHAAIKFLDPSLIEVPEMLERFLLEARSAAAVQSAHVIQVFDYGSEGGLPYIAMEFLEGENLDARLARRGALTPAELDKIFSELARGLGQAHAMGVIHRDVKPGNIFLAREGKHEVTKLIDFGIAKVKEHALRVSQIVGTELGTVLGTPQYMSPEQMRGRSTLDYRTDLWSLAIIACECLTRRYPFSGATIGDLTVQICTEQPLAPSTLAEVPPGFDDWFFKGTNKEPSDRFESAGDMAAALSKILVPGARTPASVRRSPRLVLPSALALRRAWSATFSSVMHQLASAFERARALDSKRSAAVGLALLVVACALLLLPPGRASRAPIVSAGVVASPASSGDAVSHELRAALPSAALSGVQPTPVTPAPDPVTRPTLPVLTPDDLPLQPATEVRSSRAKAPEARRRGRRQSPPATSDSSASTPSSPMSAAMTRLGALIAQGGDQPRPVRAKAAAAVRARHRASAKSE
jgi:serine/threonine-protein kinase